MTPRERAIDWARRIAAEPGAVVVDTETTSIGDDAEIIDIAIVRMDGRVLLDSFVHPLGDIPAEATAIHGISIGMIDRAKAPLWNELWPTIDRHLTHAPAVLAYNATFDWGVMERVNRRARLISPQAGWECPMLAYAEFAGERNRFGTFRWHKLGDACAAMGVELSCAHRALADAEATRRLVLAMAAADAKPAESGQLAMFETMAPETGPARDWTR